MDKNGINGKISGERDKKGKFLPGNKLSTGRPPDKIRIDEELWLSALHEVEKDKKKSFMKHIWERAYASNTVLNKVLDKLFADKGINIGKLPGGNVNIIIQTYSKKDKEKDKDITIDIQGEKQESEEK